jgi:hypothetical protein
VDSDCKGVGLWKMNRKQFEKDRRIRGDGLREVRVGGGKRDVNDCALGRSLSWVRVASRCAGMHRLRRAWVPTIRSLVAAGARVGERRRV